jgi:hypothetical protein
MAILTFSLICVRLSTWRRYHVPDAQLSTAGAPG